MAQEVSADTAKPVTQGKSRKVTDMGAIIKDNGALTDFIGRAIGLYQSSGPMIHTAFVSALWHVCVHGNPALLQRVYDGLRPNDQGAAKLYLRRAFIINGLGGEDPEEYDDNGDPVPRDSTVIAAALDAGKVLDFKNKSFVVVRGHTSNEAKALAKLCEKRFIKPDGNRDKLMLERNNFAETVLLSQGQVLDGLISAIKRIEKGNGSNNARRQFKIEDGVMKKISKMKSDLETLKGQVELSDA